MIAAIPQEKTPAKAPAVAPKKQRYLALDVLRGLTIALMVLVNNPGSWGSIYAPFKHAAWHGFTLTDLVFPSFLFVVGNAMSFSMRKFEQQSEAVFLRKVFKRSFLIFLIGLLLRFLLVFLLGRDDCRSRGHSKRTRDERGQQLLPGTSSLEVGD